MLRTGLSPFARLFTASAASNVGDGIRLAALPLLAASLTRDPAAIAAVTAAIMLPWVLFGWIGGAIVDRVDRVRLLLGAQLARAAVVILLALVVLMESASMPLVYLAAFVFGTCEMLSDTTMQTLVPAVVDDARLEHANGRLYASQTMGNDFVGPPAGSLLFAAIPAAPFALTAIAWAAGAAVLSRLRVEQPHRDERRGSLLAEVLVGVRWLFAQPMLRALVLWAFFVNAGLAAFTSLYVLFALEVLGVGEAAYGFLTAAAGIGGVTGTLLAGRVVSRFGRGIVVQGGSVLAGAAAIGAGVTASAVPFAALLFVLTGAAAVVIIVLTSLRQSIVPGRLLGRAVASMRAVTFGALPIGALFGGWLASVTDLRTPFLLGGSVVIVAGLLIGRWLSPAAIERARADARSAAA